MINKILQPPLHLKVIFFYLINNIFINLLHKKYVLKMIGEFIKYLHKKYRHRVDLWCKSTIQ